MLKIYNTDMQTNKFEEVSEFSFELMELGMFGNEFLCLVMFSLLS